VQFESALVEICNFCSLAKCLHCSTCAVHLLSTRAYTLPFTLYRRVLGYLAERGCKVIEISGGEPLLLWDYIESALAIAREFPDIRIKIFTNLIAPLENLVRLASYLAKLDNVEVHFPLHGDEATHSLVMQSSTHLPLVARILEVLKLAELGNVCANTVVSRYLCSYMALRRLLEICEKLKVRQVSLLRLVPHGRARHNMWLCPGILDYARFYQALKLIDEEASYEVKIRLGCPIAPRRITLRSNIFRITHECTSGERHICVLPDGTVLPCVAFKGLRDRYRLGSASELPELDTRWFVEEKQRSSNCWYCYAQYIYYNGIDLAKLGEEIALRECS